MIKISVTCAAILLTGAAAHAAPMPAASTDTAIWRATHSVLLTVVRVGNRLIAAGDRGTILLSDSGGAEWIAVRSGTDELLTSAVFTSATEGFIAGQDSTILHTTDAGAHWAKQTTPKGADQALFSIASLGGAHLIATGAYALVLETQDSGAVWNAVKLPSLDEDYHLNCVLGRGADVVVTGEAGHAFLRHGETWTPVPVPYAGSQFGCLTGPDASIYSFGLRGSMFVSAAASAPAASGPSMAAWKRIDTGEQRPIFGGTVLADGSFALVGGNGLLMLFDPRTAKLRVLPPPTGAALSGVAEAAGGRLVLVGTDGVHVVDPAAAPVPEVTQ